MSRIRLAISLLALALVLVALAAPAGAITIVINNGLAPPNPANVIDSLSDDDVLVQNVGCNSTVQSPCPMPWGDPTSVDLVSWWLGGGRPLGA